MGKVYFNAYHSYLQTMEPLNDAERGRLFTACLQYSMTGEVPDLRGNERFIFPGIRSQIDKDMEKDRAYVEKQRKNGRKGGRPKKPKESQKTQAFFGKPTETQTNPAVNEEEKGAPPFLPPSPFPQTPIPYPPIIPPSQKEEGGGSCGTATPPGGVLEQFSEVYNQVCTALPKCKVLTEKRKKAIRAFCKQLTAERWEEVCRLANESPFCTGRNDRGWKADFDFLIKPDKAANVLEGRYSGKRTEYDDSYEEGTSF